MNTATCGTKSLIRVPVICTKYTHHKLTRYHKVPDNIVSDIYLFADDTKIFNNTIVEDNSKILQEDLNRLQEWSDKWLLKFHPSK